MWTGNPAATDFDTFSKYSGTEIDDVVSRFPSIQKPDWRREVIRLVLMLVVHSASHIKTCLQNIHKDLHQYKKGMHGY